MFETMRMLGSASSEENATMRMPIEEMTKHRIVMVKIDETDFRRAKIESVDLVEEKVTIKDCDQWIYPYLVVPCKDVFYMAPQFMELPFKVRNQLKDLDADYC
jgi:NADH dehydrogenase FAD-containing subunit